MKTQAFVFGLAAALSVFAAGDAIAQSSEERDGAARASEGVGEIVVTARRVQESLQDVPVAVTALSGAQLEALGVAEINDVARFTPNAYVTRSPLGGSDANFAIRGLRQDDFIVSFDPAIGLYVDGIYIGRTVGAALDTLDLERVEVLRGPQGTLFGRNTIGGAVNVVSRRPTQEQEGRAEIGFGSRDLAEVALMGNLPLVDGLLAARASLSYRVQDGPGKSVYFPGRTAGDIDDLAGRVSLLFTPSQKLDVLVATDVTRGRGTTRHTLNRGSSTTAAPFPFLSPPFRTLPADINADSSPNIYLDWRSVDPVNRLDVRGVSITAEYRVNEAVTLKSISSYRDLKATTGTDFDGTGYRSFDQTVTTSQDQFSQELQIAGEALEGKLDFVGGVYFFTEDFTQILPMNIRSQPIRLDPRVFTNVQQRFGTNTSYAVFGQATMQWTDRLSTTLGIRWSEDEKDLRLDDFFLNNLGVQVGPFPPGAQPLPTRQIRDISLNDTFPSWTPRVGAEYRLTDDALLYISYARGFRSGGFNGRPVGERGNLQPFQPEELATWEAGAKTQFFNDRLRANVAVFLGDYTNIQTVLRDGATFRVINAEAELNGIEGEFAAQIARDTQLTLNVGWMDAEYTSVPAGFVFRSGNKLPLTPEMSATLGVQQGVDLGTLGRVTLRADYIHTGDVFFQASNLPTELQKAYGLINLRAEWENESGRLGLAAYVKNAAEEEYFTFGIDARGGFGPFYLFPGDPREAGVSATVRF
jgi:iron complex outermembrane receptor protein